MYVRVQVRTERVNPHVLSVRINEGAGESDRDRKHLAYLLDRQTIAVVDLTTGKFRIPAHQTINICVNFSTIAYTTNE